MDRWKQAITAAKLQSLAESLRRPEVGEDGLGAAFHPEDYGATDDIQQAAAQGEGGDDDGDAEKARYATLREAQDHEARELVQALGLQSQPRRRKHHKEPSGPESGVEVPTAGSSTPEGNTGATTPEEGLGASIASPGGSGLLSTLLRLSALERGIVNKEYFLNKEYLNESESEKKVKWYEQEEGKGTSSSLPKLASFVNAAQPRRLFPKQKEQVKLTVHVATILARQRYIMQLCRAFMAYGAPTHRLEQYMLMTANVLDVNAQFLYLPGCMVMSFDDAATHTAQVKLVRATQGLDLSRLTETHNIYKTVVHDIVGVEEAAQELDKIMKRKPRYNKPFLIILHGLASAAIGPWAFDARPIDMPIIFFLGSLVGFMQHVVAPYSTLYSNVFEVSMAIITSFLARAFGSIPATGPFVEPDRKYVFCFSSIAQSSICLILPGFSVLCSSLELQSHQIIAGSVRMVYTIIYSLFLGYGVTIGTTIYGLIDGNATTEQTCHNAAAPYGNKYTQHFPFVAAFCLLAGLVNQARLRQTPIMMVFGLAGYVTNYFCTDSLGSSTGLANTVGAFTLGTVGNLYSRIWHGHAATAIIPGIFTIVSSGLAATGAIISGLAYSTAIKNGTVGELNVNGSNNSLTGLGLGMVEVAIGVSVGLFISNVVVYPYGKQRSGLFNF